MAKITTIGGVPLPEYLLVPANKANRSPPRKLSPQELQAELDRCAREIEINNQRIADAHAVLHEYRPLLLEAEGELKTALETVIAGNEQLIRASEDAVGALIMLDQGLRRSNGDTSARVINLSDQALRK